MKIFILCGGFGSRLDNEGRLKAKPMIRIGNKPILMHLIETFINQGFHDFVICTGHKSETITKHFLNQKKQTIIISKEKNVLNIKYKYKNSNLNINIIYTGINVGTGGRLKIACESLKLKEDIFVTYGDGLANVNIKNLIKFHYKKKSLMTMAAVRPKERYGLIEIKNNKILYFDNQNRKADRYVNGGFFVIDKSAIKKIKYDHTYWEIEPLNFFTKKKNLYAFKHNGFWKSLDTLKDKNDFNKIYYSGKKLPWKI